MTLSSKLIEIKDFLFSKNSSACEDCFLGYLVWQKKYGFERLESDNIPKDLLLVKINNNSSYYVPFSKDESAVKKIIDELLKKPGLVFERVTQAGKNFLEKYFPDRFDFTEDRGNADYLYDVDSLCTLKGNKLSKKRNHINGFLSSYSDWYVKPVEQAELSQVKDFIDRWYAKRAQSDGENASLNFEKQAVLEMLENFSEIGADGLVLYVEGKVAAFTAGQKISDSVYDTVFEKASEVIKGAYNMINREFARYLKEKYPSLEYINRESDVNHPGLRQAKLSYMPAFILEKFIAKAKY